MNRNAIARVIIYSILIVILLIALVVGLSFNVFSFNRHIGRSETIDGETVNSGESLSFDNIENISIEWACGEINMEEADVDTIQISEVAPAGSKHHMIVAHSGNSLEIRYSESNWKTGFNISTPNKTLNILVPRGCELNTLEIDAASADTNITGLSIRDVDLDTASGEYTFRDCDVATVDMDSASGDLRFTGTLQSLDFDGASASAELTLSNTPKELKMDSVSGTMDLVLPEGSGFTLKKETLSGSFSCDFPTTNSDGRIVCGDGSCRIDMSGVSGNIHIRKAS